MITMELLERSVRVAAGGRHLFDYVFDSQVPLGECRKPYFHPLRTLAGDVVTNFRPHDHPWHHALAMTMTLVSGMNFWGGATYKKGQGYLMLPDIGEQRHIGWDPPPTCDAVGGGFSGTQKLEWVSAEGELIFRERRTISVPHAAADFAKGRWKLDLSMHFQNATSRELALGHFAASEGLAGSNYTGLILRLPREFLATTIHGQVHDHFLSSSGAKTVEEIHGKEASWLAVIGTHDGTLRRSTVVLKDNSATPPYPPLAFVRSHLPMLSLPFVKHEEIRLPPSATLDLGYTLHLADGALDHARITELLGGQ